MSDHYCCKNCHQRYDRCVCRSDDNIVNSVKRLVARQSSQLEGESIPSNKVAAPLSNILIVGFGNLGKQTADLLDAWKPLSTHRWELTVVDVGLNRKKLKGYDAIDSRTLEEDPNLFKKFGTIILCVPSDSMMHWMVSFADVVAGHHIICRTTLSLDSQYEERFKHFAYVPEFATEHSIKKSEFDLDCYSASSPSINNLVCNLFGAHWRKVPFKAAVATKLLRNAAVAVNAVFHNTALAMMRDHDINPSHINTFTFLDLPHMALKRTRLPRNLMFGGRCLKPSLQMLPPLQFWQDIIEANEDPFWAYVYRLVNFIREKAQKKTFTLVVCGMHYNSSEPTSSFEHSVAESFLHGTVHRSPLRVVVHETTSKAHVKQMKESLHPVDVRLPKEVVNGIILLQPASNKEALISSCLPAKRKKASGDEFPQFYVFDPLMQIQQATLEKLQAGTNSTINLVQKLE